MNRKEFINAVRFLRANHIHYDLDVSVFTDNYESHKIEVRFVFPTDYDYKKLPKEIAKLPYGTNFETGQYERNTRVIESRRCNRKFAQHYVEYERATRKKAEEALEKYRLWEKKATR